MPLQMVFFMVRDARDALICVSTRTQRRDGIDMRLLRLLRLYVGLRRRLRTKAVLLSLADGDLQGLERAAPDYPHRHGVAHAVPCEQTL